MVELLLARLRPRTYRRRRSSSRRASVAHCEYIACTGTWREQVHTFCSAEPENNYCDRLVGDSGTYER